MPLGYAASIIRWGRIAMDRSEPEGSDFIDIATGEVHSLALKSDGTIIGWSSDYYRQSAPPQDDDFIAIAAGNSHSLALRNDGTIVSWGSDYYGQAARYDGNDFVAIAAGHSHSFALKSDGSIVGWGENNYGQTDVPVGNDFIGIAAGGGHSLALKSDGAILGWGRNDFGQAIPPDGNDFIAIAAGEYHSLAIRADGSIVGWGWNDYGQADSPEGNNFVGIAAGKYHSLALVNVKPIANAGSGRTAYAGIDGFAKIALNGSGSYDQDGDELDYFWSWKINDKLFNAIGIKPRIQLPAGEHKIQLIVYDGWVESETSYCKINVIEPLQVNIMCSPKHLYHHNFDRHITVVITMPDGINPSDINSERPFQFLPGGIASSKPSIRQVDTGKSRRTYVIVSFNKSECIKRLKTGSNKINIVGRLNSGRYFYGTDYLQVINFNQ